MKKRPTIAISPVSNDYLTKGKAYSIVDLKLDSHKYGYKFSVIDDTGRKTFTYEHNSRHLNFRSWTLARPCGTDDYFVFDLKENPFFWAGLFIFLFIVWNILNR